MKVRQDFVTNSSSSSFILAFDSKEDGAEKISAMAKRYGSDYVMQLLHDFMEATPIKKEMFESAVINDVRDDAEFLTDYGEGSWWSSDKPTFQKRWREAHPNSEYIDYFDSPERAAEVERHTKELLSKIKEDIGDKEYLVELEYEDHTDVGSELEHHILPEQEFTVRRFNHH